MDIRTEDSVPTAPPAPALAVATDPNAVLQDMVVRYFGMALGPLAPPTSADPAAESAGFGPAANPFSSEGPLTGRPQGGLLAQISPAETSPDGDPFPDSLFGELPPRCAGADRVVCPAPRLADAAGLGAANSSSENAAGELDTPPVAPRFAAATADKAPVTERSTGGAPTTQHAAALGSNSMAVLSAGGLSEALTEWVLADQRARQTDRTKRESLETPLIAEISVFAGGQVSRAYGFKRLSLGEVPQADGSAPLEKRVCSDYLVKASLNFLGRKAPRWSKRDPRQKHKDQKKQGKGPWAQQDESDDPESP